MFYSQAMINPRLHSHRKPRKCIPANWGINLRDL